MTMYTAGRVRVRKRDAKTDENGKACEGEGAYVVYLKVDHLDVLLVLWVVFG